MFKLEQAVNSGALRFVVIDGSTVQEPGATATTYRLHIAIDLVNLSLRQVEVTTDKGSEHLGHYKLEEGDVVLVDRGYNSPKSLVPFLDRGGEVVLRYNPHSMNLYEADTEGGWAKIDWEKRLQPLQKQAGYVPAYLHHQGKRVQGYVHAIPLPPDKIVEARRKAKRRANKKGNSISEKALSLGEWVLIFTSLPPVLLNTETAAALYRVRWQVELVIKRLKSLLAVDQLRAHKGCQLAELYLQGKLLYAAVVEKVAQRRFASALMTMDGKRELTTWRLWRTVADDIRLALKACFPVDSRFDGDCLKSLKERKRKRQLQALPPPVLIWVQQCQSK